MNDATIRGFRNKHGWAFAKTYADICQQEYIVKDKLDWDDLDDYACPIAIQRVKGAINL